MVSRGTKKPYVQAIGASATGVTQSCYIVRFKKYVIMLDCGLYQESDIATNYKKNQELLKKIKPRDIDWIILHECHADHTCLVPALYARGCQAHLYVPCGSKQFLKLLWEDSMKIFTQDCQKLNNKGIKAAPFYTQKDIDNALNRMIELEYDWEFKKWEHKINESITLKYVPSNHILYACQVYLDFHDKSLHHRLGFTGDIGGETPQPYVEPRQTMPYVNLLLGENTYNDPSRRFNKQYDRVKDVAKIVSVIQQSNRVLIPCFSFGRTQTMLHLLYELWDNEVLPDDIKVIVDSPLAQQICKIWPWNIGWGNIHFVESWAESQQLQKQNDKCVIISASGMMNGGRVVEWAKTILPNPNNTILFCGYSSENTLATQIRYGNKSINIDGTIVQNNANIVELVSFSSHANYDELMDYYTNQCRYDKIALVHGDMKYKPDFARKLQDRLVNQGKSSRVIAVNADSKIYF